MKTSQATEKYYQKHVKEYFYNPKPYVVSFIMLMKLTTYEAEKNVLSQFSSQTYNSNAKNITLSHPEKENLSCAKDVHPRAQLDSSKTSRLFHKQKHNVGFFCEKQTAALK